jgi:hypothetical protein
MARGQTNKLYRNFTAGLITEASLLTYPENSCIDLDNCVLSQKGNVKRRKGIDYEPNAAQSFEYVNDLGQYAYNEFVWEAVGGRSGHDFLVIQTSTAVRFYDMASDPISAGRKDFVIDMATRLAPNATLADAQKCQMQFASGKGYLWIVGEKFEPVLVTYDHMLDWITIQPIYILMRDFAGVNDGLAPDFEPTTLSEAHNYNLLNQGWITPSNAGAGPSQLVYDSSGQPGLQASPGSSPITDYFTATGRYPGNNKQWWVARDSTTNAFKPDLLETFFYGATRVPRGHFVVNAFNKDRSAVSGVAGLTAETTNARPTAVAFFSGRAVYVCESNVYFSQVLDDRAKVGMCFQEADPTSETISDLIATDGGVIPIPEMGRALRAFPAAGGVLIFANNGVWYVGGGQGGFSALDFSVIKVSSIGTSSPNSIVDTKRGIFWFDRTGLRALTVESGSSGPVFDLQTPSEKTIQTFVQETIPADAKAYIKGAYDPHNNVVQWLFSTLGAGYDFDRILTLDMKLGAFYPWSISHNGPKLVGIFENPRQGLWYRVATHNGETWTFSFAYERDETFVDFKSADGVGQDYLSFLESGYELLDDAMRKKEQNYIFVYLRRTEQNWIDDVPDRPSSCFFQTKWDWADHQVSNKWTNKVQVYRHTRLPLYDDTDTAFNTGFPIVVTKNKVRGHGRAIQFRFESGGPGKDFDLLGWAVAYSGNSEP